MVGQDKLVGHLFSQDIQYSPKTMLFLGEYGCGKHTLAKEYAERFGLEYMDVSEGLSADSIAEYQARPVPTLYLIDASSLTEKVQNSMLKFIEEPGDFAHIIIVCDNPEVLLPTIKNRCVQYKFEEYSRDTLREFVSPMALDDEIDLILDSGSTPGQIMDVEPNRIKELDSLSTAFVDKLQDARFDNALSLVAKCKDNVLAFLNLTIKKLYNKYMAGFDDSLLGMYELTKDYKNRLIRFPKLNAEQLMYNYVTVAWMQRRKA